MAGQIEIEHLEEKTAQEVLAYAIEHLQPGLKVACSFQKEESVILHMLSELDVELTAFVIDTGVFFPETLEVWEAFKQRFPKIHFQTIDARRPDEGLDWTRDYCCSKVKIDGVIAKVRGLNEALSDASGWITGIRHEQSPTRADTPKLEEDGKHGIWKVNPLADWTEKDIWKYIFEHDLPYNKLHDLGYASIGCATCTLAGEGREGRWSGEDKTECGIHL